MEKTTKFLDDLDARLWSENNKGDHAKETVSHRLDVVLRECGYAQRSKTRLEYLQRLFTSRGMIPSPALTTEGLEREERIRFSRSEPAVVAQSFRNEKALQAFLAENVKRLEQFRGYELKQTEYHLKTGDQIDMLLENRKRKTWLVVELEKDQKDESPAQLLRYMREVKEHRLPAGYTVEGMVISGRPRPEQVEIFKTAQYPGKVQWLVYSIRLELTPAEGSIIAPENLTGQNDEIR